MTPAPPEIPLPLPEARRLVTPTRESLLERFAAGERQARQSLWMEAFVVAAGGLWWFLRPSPLLWWEALLLTLAGFLGMFDFLFYYWTSPRKPLEKVKAEAKLGPHTRDSLLAAVEITKARLGLTGRDVKVFLVPEKEINAFAMRQELLPGISLTNGVLLNRAIIHLLDEEELISVIGHELGHVFPYVPLSRRFLLLHGLLSAVITLAVAGILRDTTFLIAAPLAGITVARWVAWSMGTDQIRLVEFLCDDCAAVAGGLIPAARSELKIALESEARSRLLEKVLEAKLAHQNIPITTLLREYEEAMPFGTTKSPEIQAMLERRIQAQVASAQTSSWRGFFDYLWKSGDTDEATLRAQLKKMRVLRSVARVPCDPDRLLNADVPGAETALEELATAIENHPKAILTASAEEITDLGSTHPNPSRRLLFLWRNRAAYPRH